MCIFRNKCDLQMRGIPFEIFILILVALLFIESLFYKRLRSNQYQIQPIVRYIILGITICTYFVFIVMYFNPDRIKHVQDYRSYLTFNTLFTCYLALKLPLMIFYLCSPAKLTCNSSRSILLAIYSVTILLSICLGAFIGSRKIHTEYVTVVTKELPKGIDSLRIAQISDLHAGNFYFTDKYGLNLATKINNEKPDIIVFTGDLINNFAHEYSSFINVFDSMYAPLGKYAILGNHDYGDYSIWKDSTLKQSNFDKTISFYRKTNFTILRNETIQLKINKCKLNIIGVENWGNPPFHKYGDLRKSLCNVPSSDYQILLTHDPGHWAKEVLRKEDINLTLSGHTHGSQIGIVIAGIKFSPYALLNPYWGGLYKQNNQWISTNIGLGNVGIASRINMPPTLTIITLKRIEVNQ
ncbi:hypothetical protein EYV94_13835 [Puteibacter caeruleilacunae]|nr:hypothetical protein EYV94_13835 [Puteibacter caeruleilacunae]